jgi:hypothetical protein
MGAVSSDTVVFVLRVELLLITTILKLVGVLFRTS